MSLDENIVRDAQQPQLDELVTMYELDTSLLGGPVYRFTPNQHADFEVRYNGNVYYPLFVEAEGFEYTGKGQLPRPKVRVGLVGDGPALVLREAIRQGNDLVGCKLTRRRTFKKYLDMQESPNWNAQFLPDVYVVERKTYQDKTVVEWELSAYMDHEGVLIPARQVLRDSCRHTYRVWNSDSGSFDYTRATCPYTGAGYFKRDGTETETASEDECGRKLSDCKLRFPDAPLPTRAFPGVSRARM